jgi:hypothetical protein
MKKDLKSFLASDVTCDVFGEIFRALQYQIQGRHGRINKTNTIVMSINHSWK